MKLTGGGGNGPAPGTGPRRPPGRLPSQCCAEGRRPQSSLAATSIAATPRSLFFVMLFVTNSCASVASPLVGDEVFGGLNVERINVCSTLNK